MRTYSQNWEPGVYTPERIEIETRWMLCPHDRGFHRNPSDYFIKHIEVCRDCGMPRVDSMEAEKYPDTYTFIRPEFYTDDQGQTYMTFTLTTIPVGVPDGDN